MHALRRIAVIVASAYALIWGVSWSLADLSIGVSGVAPGGESFSYYPGAFLGGLPPTPSLMSDAPQALAALGGAVGLVYSALTLVRSPRKSSPPN